MEKSIFIIICLFVLTTLVDVGECSDLTKGQIVAASQSNQEKQREREKAQMEAQKEKAAEKKAREAQKSRDKFIAISHETMRWEKARDYCASKGGQLPLINGRTLWNGGGTASIAGVGAKGKPLPPALHRYNYYWTGTQEPDYYKVWVFFDWGGGVIDIAPHPTLNAAHAVVCVP